jgi:cysteine-S-conjugate beta-lyase
MKYDFETVFERRVAGTGRSEKWGRHESDVLPMWVADMDFPAPPKVTEALTHQAESPFYCYERYPEELFSAFIAWVRSRHGWEIEREDILPVPGVVFGLNAAARALDPEGQGLAVHVPAYPPLLRLAGNYGADTLPVNLAPRSIDSSDPASVLESALEDSSAAGSRPGLFALCNPQNPLGRCFGRVELKGLLDVCARNDLFVLSDEIWSDLTFTDSSYLPAAAAAPEHADRIVTFMAPSKTFNVAGLSLSFAIIPDDDLRRRVEDACRGIMPMINSFGMEAAMVAYTSCSDWSAELRQVLQENRYYVDEFVRMELPGVWWDPPNGTYLAWLDFRNTPIADDPAGEILRRGRVALNPGPSFGDAGYGFARLNFACPRPSLREGLERIARVVKGVV